MLYLLSAAPMLCCNVAAAQCLSAALMQLRSFVLSASSQHYYSFSFPCCNFISVFFCNYFPF